MGFIEPALYWLLIGVMLLVLELALPGFVLFFFGLGALITALAAWLTPISIAWQLGLFILSSAASLLALRSLIRKHFFQPSADAAVAGDQDVDTLLAVPGDRGVVVTSIVPPAEGRIKYSGTFWRATADEMIEEGEIISVVRQLDLVIHVEKV
jgi:membrane protein implicated in regulation of membrane protease activity